MMLASDTPPAGWQERISAPCQSEGFARAMTTMGYRPLFLSGERGQALALLRGWFPGVRRLTSRANLFAPRADREFVREALAELAGLGLAYVKVGDTMWGLSWSDGDDSFGFPRTTLIRRHTFVLDVTQDESSLLARMDGVERKIRKAAREGVVVREVRSEEELGAYCRLSRETSTRIRGRWAYTDFPDAFFRMLFRTLASGGAARFYVAWAGQEPLAGCLFLCSADTMLYYLGGSTRDRDLTMKQAPAAIFWHAIREAKRLGLSRFDFGGCTPTDDPGDPRYGVYAFKKRWGGRLETFANVEVVLSPLAWALQQGVLSPLWDRIHPVFFRLLHARGGTR